MDYNESKNLALVEASLLRAKIRLEGMKAENTQRMICGASIAYVEDDFVKIIDEEGLSKLVIINQLF